MSKENPKKNGRPFGKRIPLALEAAQEASLSIDRMTEVMDSMTENQRTLFESIMSGEDALKTCLRSKHPEWYTGIIKILRDKEGKVVMADTLTLDTVDDLDDDSYERVLSVCESKLRENVGMQDYRKFTEPIQEYIKRYTPLALGNIVRLSRHAKKEDIQLRASQDILNRAGEKAIDPEKDFSPSVQVNILLTGDNGTVIPYNN